MSTTPDGLTERAARLAEHHQQTATSVATLRDRIAALTAEHHDALMGARFSEAGAASADLVDLTRQLERGESDLAAVEVAQRAVAEERRRRDLAVELDAVDGMRAHAARVAGERLESAGTAFTAAAEQLRAALDAENAVGQHARRAHELRVALGTAAPARILAPSAVATALASRPDWAGVLAAETGARG